MRFAGRMRRLERVVGKPGPFCVNPEFSLILDREPGGPDPPIPDNVPRCLRCGEQHVLVVEEIVTDADSVSRRDLGDEPRP